MHGPSTRGKFLIAALVVALIGSFLCMFSPLIFAQTFYYSRDTILMLIPSQNFVLLGVAMLLVMSLLVLLAFIRTRWSYALAAVLVACALTTTYAAFISITLIEEDGMVVNDVFTKQQYAWDDVAAVTYYYTAHTDEGAYVFILKGGKEITIAETPLFDDYKKNVLRTVLDNYHIPFQTVSH